jgi:adenylate cyclase
LADRSLAMVDGDEERLKALLDTRLEADADRKSIDQRIWDLFGEHWAIMITDLSGYSRQVEAYGITHFMQSIYESHKLFCPIVEDHDGWLLQDYADNLLILFRKPQKALSCAIALQHASEAYNADRAELDHIVVCIGIGVGEVLRIGPYKIFGQQVNAASKLGEDTATGGEILVTGAFRDAIADAKNVAFHAIEDFPHSAEAAYRIAYRI